MPIIKPYLGKWPEIAGDAFIAENATVIGDVTVGSGASVWYGAVVRGDVGPIRIGAGTNIQDLACLHSTHGLSELELGEFVTVGHGAILHGAKIGAGCLIGMGSIVLDNADIGAESLVAAGTVVTPRTVVPPRSLVRGQPGRVARALTETEWPQGRASAEYYVQLGREHRTTGT
ncbi:MAG TPA: gamma carbonic anhydrase family protein [Polyangiaceae bacterium]|jgi:carbonic anhydrase/acetyltransferase-like protein (isoleucine patch superfamily)|nr:gamma carbonic anhydrase family protein [Polyangiaceae bacterium]